jgi:hypothetical protein
MKQLQEATGNSARAFVMVNAPIRQDPETGEAVHGYYDPETQTWVGEKRIGAGTYSSRSNGSKGGYSHQSDD